MTKNTSMFYQLLITELENTSPKWVGVHSCGGDKPDAACLSCLEEALLPLLSEEEEQWYYEKRAELA